MKDLHTYHLKLTALSPVHIGTGESYEPTNFVIDDGMLYEFDEVLFYKSLSDVDKKALNNKMGSWLQIIEFYKTKKEQAKEISFFECQVSKEVQSKYDAKNPNQLQINRTFKNPNTHRAIIPGSSIKGMLDTVFGIYPPKSSNEERQKLIISDALLLDGGVKIGYSNRKHRYKEKAGKGIPQMVEVIQPNSTFILSIKTKLSFEQIQELMKMYHSNRKNSLYKEEKNSFVARIGKYCGKEYMVYDGKNVKNKDGNPLATHSLYNSDKLKDAMFGWVKFELIDENEYKKSLQLIKKQEEEYYKYKDKKQAKVIQDIKKAEYEAKKLALEKQKKEEEEKRKLAEAKAKREAELAAMSPVERIIDSYETIALLINAMKDSSIENFEEIKIELAQKVKEELQKDPKNWDRAKQKALKRKEYIESILNR